MLENQTKTENDIKDTFEQKNVLDPFFSSGEKMPFEFKKITHYPDGRKDFETRFKKIDLLQTKRYISDEMVRCISKTINYDLLP